MISKQQVATIGNGMMCPSDRRQNHLMRQIVIIAQRWKTEMGPYNTARFLCNSQVPLHVALRVIVGRHK